MPIQDILTLLIAERQKLDLAIQALGGTPIKKRGRPAKNALANAPAWVTGSASSPVSKPARKKRVFTAKQRKEQAQRMKAYWAAKKKASKS